MQYVSTRGGNPVSGAQAIVQGICPSGGLYVPERFPTLDTERIFTAQGYQGVSQAVMQLFLDIPDATLTEYVQSAYGKAFDTPAIAPLVPLSATESVLELFHGPTLAFKDMALQMLPYLMRDSLLRTGEDKQVYILVATSGDTGKAALEGFCNVPNTAIQVFYPHGGVSHAQWLQMATQQGSNVFVTGVKGNFDDAQTAVKQIFANDETAASLAGKGYRLSSANSINFGRLLPQISYYVSAYKDLVTSERIQNGERINFCVPTGNFGNILAGYYAMRMGLPIHKLICASNRNNVLTDFFQRGTYNAKRPFHKSMSCSIDILISSNLERLLFDAANRNSTQVATWMRDLSAQGNYDVGAMIVEGLGEIFYADWCDEADTLQTICAHFERENYLMDPHTAVAQTIYDRYLQKTGDNTQTVLLSTANPYKFASGVLAAFESPQEDDFVNIDRLFAITGCAIPESIHQLKEKPVLHTAVCELSEMPQRVLGVL